MRDILSSFCKNIFDVCFYLFLAWTKRKGKEKRCTAKGKSVFLFFFFKENNNPKTIKSRCDKTITK